MATITWSTDQVTSFQTEDIFEIERATSLYFSELLADKSHSAFQDNSEVFSAVAQVKKQKVGNNYVVLESVVDIINIGDEAILDAASLLMFLTNKNTTNSSFTHLDTLINVGYSIGMISFSNENESSSMVLAVDDNGVAMEESKYTAKERTLITVTTILAFALFAISVLLFWVAGGWLALRKQVKILLYREEEQTRAGLREIKKNPTHDTDEEAGSPTSSNGKETQFTNPSGILGVNPNYRKSGALNGLGIKMTPARRGLDDGDAASDVFTPMSQATSYSDTGRMPLGITSMRKLVPGRENVEAKTPNALQRNSLGASGMKRLEYAENNEEEVDL
jgi:hypothetical protein